MWVAPYFFLPYYTLFAVAALYHGLNGAYAALATLGVPVPRGLRAGVGFWLPVGSGAAVAIAAVLAIAGWLYPIADPTTGEVARLAERLLGTTFQR
jgi:hypothetical protein